MRHIHGFSNLITFLILLSPAYLEIPRAVVHWMATTKKKCNHWVLKDAAIEGFQCSLFQVTSDVKLGRKQVDDVLGGKDEWKNVQKTEGIICLESVLNM